MFFMVHKWAVVSSYATKPSTPSHQYTYSFLYTFEEHVKCWQGEFVYQSRASLVGDHFLFPCNSKYTNLAWGCARAIPIFTNHRKWLNKNKGVLSNFLNSTKNRSIFKVLVNSLSATVVSTQNYPIVSWIVFFSLVLISWKFFTQHKNKTIKLQTTSPIRKYSVPLHHYHIWGKIQQWTHSLMTAKCFSWYKCLWLA